MSTPDRYLTLDMGNTNASLAFVSFEGGLTVRWLSGWASAGNSEGATRAAEVASQELDLALEEFAAAGEARPLRAGISAVGDRARELRVVERLEAAGCAVLARPDAGLVMDIDHPETCGSDRQYAMRAALEDQWELRRREGQSLDVQALVIDAGTALTVDAGRASEGPSGSPELTFLGGAIAMGPGSLAEAMAARGARLPRFDIDPAAPALGRSTVEALQSGVAVGFRGTVAELLRGVAAEAFGSRDGVSVYLTGGARGFARRAVSEACPDGFHESAHLVHAGLGRALRSARWPTRS